MRSSIERIPISIGGVILGITAMGNLLYDYISYSREICGIIAILLTALVVLKLIYYPKYFKEDLNNPILASIIATFSMALMLIANYISPYIGLEISYYIWIFAILLHIFFLINYIYKFVLHFKLENYTAGSFVVFAGVQMIAITAPVFNQEYLGSIAFYFSFICVVLVFLVVCYRYLKIPVAGPVKPIIGVYGAPFSLCAVGYLSSVTPINTLFAASMYMITKILYIMILYKFISYIKYPLYPTYAAYTFPVVINAVTTLKLMNHFNDIGLNTPLMEIELIIEIVISILLVAYVLRYFLIVIFEIERREMNI
ncbi:MAG: hypothetical protein BZ133_03330 [Methanosphaera sp. SHI613]|jgi:exfoliative toxin A/B|nr:MAG: hypothetical protein BZ133_03330 [Methanosphaera sp. SHI613]